ncbi:hypothetical protein SU86_000500 [Candidatus Nitrosotenuis cloacae]|uniref:Uncharacterized protein n=1 Tax=Candidatus Nitrosotenuis cloacae TaxID=1603555 RepID=A0A3G1AYZ4_9ARCH|nr:hypothetical protein SU86_000500 [Candidatus Nitrosotenuis cloacae]
MICSGVSLYKIPKKSSDETPIESDPEKNKSNLIAVVSASLYGVIAGFSIKTSLDKTFEQVIGRLNDLHAASGHITETSFRTLLLAITDTHYEIFMAIAFISTAIPFYHGAMIFLSEKSKMGAISNLRQLGYHFGFLFLQSIILLGISLSLESFLFSIVMFVLLMLVDSLWVIIGQRKHQGAPPLGWLCLNVGFTAILFMLLYEGWDPKVSVTYLWIVCLGRTALDYALFRDMYVKH